MEYTIHAENLKFQWPKQKLLTLDIQKLQILKGEKVFLFGPSGSGKTTLLNLLAGVLSPTSGSLKVLGQELAELKAHQKDQLRASQIGYIFQMLNLIPYLDVKENITLPLQFKKSSHLASPTAAEINEHVLRLLENLNMPKNLLLQKAHQLSVGQQQRVAVARALITNPSLVIADEPTSALDQDARDSFLQLLFEQCEQNKATLIFVSHDKTLSSRFSRLISLPEINQI